jgi:kanamycin kinase
MSEADFSALGAQHTLGGDEVPKVVVEIADGRPAALIWRNDLGGLTFRVGDVIVKWNPRSSGIDLDRERVRLGWIARRHPAPQVLASGIDEEAQWLVTAALPGDCAVGDVWRARRRAMHTVAIDDFPQGWLLDSWVGRTPESLGQRPQVDAPVLVHGDACAPNTLISMEGEWTGNVDFGDLSVGDRWADLAIASLSLDWNFGEGHQDELFDAYGIDRDDARIDFYRALWHLES